MVWKVYQRQPRAWRCLLRISMTLACILVIRSNDYVTVNISMLGIYQDPIEADTSYSPCEIAPRQHLPTGNQLASTLKPVSQIQTNAPNDRPDPVLSAFFSRLAACIFYRFRCLWVLSKLVIRPIPRDFAYMHLWILQFAMDGGLSKLSIVSMRGCNTWTPQLTDTLR